MSNESRPRYDMQASTENHRPANDYWRERQRLAAQLRQLTTNLLSRENREQEVAALADHLQAFNAGLEQRELAGGRKGWLDAGWSHEHDSLSQEVSPLIGHSSVLAPPLKIWIDKQSGDARAQVNFDWRFEGPLCCAHGGFVAAVFDEFLGWAQMISGGSGATKNLSVTYHKPTPLNTTLELTARMVSVDGRKLRLEGEMYAGEVMTASAEGLFISFGEKGTLDLHQQIETQAQASE